MLNGQTYYGLKMHVTMITCPSDTVILPKGLVNVGPGLGVQGRPLRDIAQQYQMFKKQKFSLVDTSIFHGPDDVKSESSDNDKNQNSLESIENVALAHNIINNRPFRLAHVEDLINDGRVNYFADDNKKVKRDSPDKVIVLDQDSEDGNTEKQSNASDEERNRSIEGVMTESDNLAVNSRSFQTSPGPNHGPGSGPGRSSDSSPVASSAPNSGPVNSSTTRPNRTANTGSNHSSVPRKVDGNGKPSSPSSNVSSTPQFPPMRGQQVRCPAPSGSMGPFGSIFRPGGPPVGLIGAPIMPSGPPEQPFGLPRPPFRQPTAPIRPPEAHAAVPNQNLSHLTAHSGPHHPIQNPGGHMFRPPGPFGPQVPPRPYQPVIPNVPMSPNLRPRPTVTTGPLTGGQPASVEIINVS